jgi:hypothetical protein
MPYRISRMLAPGWLFLVLAVSGAWAKPDPGAEKRNPSAANSRPAASLKVDSAKVHSLYLDGEFDAAIALLEANLKENGQYRHDDSAFIFKHLGVMYAAQFDTREKGKYYMHRLLAVEPTARIIDMYASDMIYMIFRNIQDEFEQNRMYMGTQSQKRAGNDTLYALSDGKPKKDSAKAGPQAAASRSSSGKKWIWGGVAAVATVAAGVGAYYLINDEQPKRVGYEF